MEQFKKYFGKIFTALFILASLLPVKGNMMVNKVAAQGGPPIDFNRHIKYRNLSTDAKTRLSWDLNVDFRRNGIRARWTFRIEQNQQDERWDLTDEYVLNIRCNRRGRVRIANGVAHFNPNTRDHITCQTPDFNSIANDMIKYLSLGSEKISNGICTGCLDPWMNGEIRVQPTTNRTTLPIAVLKSLEPIKEVGNDESSEDGYSSSEENDRKEAGQLAHEESEEEEIAFSDEDGHDESNDSAGDIYSVFQTEAVFDPNDLSVHHLSSHITDWKVPERSGMTSQSGWYNFWTGMNVNRFLETLEQRHNGGYQTAWLEHWAKVHNLPKDVNSLKVADEHWFSWAEGANHSDELRPAQDYTMSNGAQIFYIGHNPETGEYFRGKMRNIGVDPGCIGYG